MEQCCNERMISLYITKDNTINDDFLHLITNALDWSYTQADQLATLITFKGRCKVQSDTSENISALSRKLASLNISHIVE